MVSYYRNNHAHCIKISNRLSKTPHTSCYIIIGEMRWLTLIFDVTLHDDVLHAELPVPRTKCYNLYSFHEAQDMKSCLQHMSNNVHWVHRPLSMEHNL